MKQLLQSTTGNPKTCKFKALAITFWCVLVLAWGNTHAQGTNFSAAPAKSGQDVKGSGSSVSLASGEVVLSLPLGSVPGRNGLGGGVAASYTSAVRQAVKTWNREAPTGALGLGWTLEVPRIVADHRNTGTREDDAFYLMEGGSPVELVRTGTFVEAGVIRHSYVSRASKSWKIDYIPASEQWKVTREDGTLYVYGGSEGNTVQWTVKWGNWMGASAIGAGQSRQAVAWNLASVENTWGDRTTFSYEVVEELVGARGMSYTKASYLKRVTDALGNRLELIYGEKGASEYEDPHQEQAEPDAYQELYETKFLDRVEAYSDKGLLTGKVQLVYSTVGTGNLTKRVLTSVTTYDRAGEQAGVTRYEYFTSGEDLGRIKKVTGPTGAVAEYAYAPVTVANSPRSRTVSSAGGHTVRMVQQHRDYVVVLFSNGEVHAYRWEGEWRGGLLTTLTGVEWDANKLPVNFQLKLEENFFSLLYKPSGTTNRYLKMLTYSGIGQAGGKNGWELYEETLGVEGILLTGDRFTAVQSKGYNTLRRYVLTGRNWRKDEFTDNTLALYQIATATKNYIVANASSKVALHVLQEDGSWTTKDLGAFDPVAQTIHAADGYVILGRYSSDNSRSSRLIWWDENFNIKPSITIGYYPWNTLFSVSKDMFVVKYRNSGFHGEKTFRFDGGNWKDDSWSEYNFVSDHYSSVGEDITARTWLDGSTAKGVLYKKFNPNSAAWETELSITGSNLSSIRIGDGYLAYHNKIFQRNKEGVYQEIPSLIALTSSRTIGEEARGPWWDAGNGMFAFTGKILNEWIDGTTVYAKKNGEYFSRQILNQAVYLPGVATSSSSSSFNYTAVKSTQNTNSTFLSRPSQLVGGGTVITYPYLNQPHNTLSNSAQITLHRLVDGELAGQQVARPVRTVTVNDGYRTVPTSYAYDAAQAVMDPTGQTALFGQVTMVVGSADPAVRPNGYTKSHFYNGLPVQQNGSGNAFTHFRLLTGAPFLTEVLDKDNAKVSASGTSYNVVEHAIQGQGGQQVSTGYQIQHTQTWSMLDGVITTVDNTYNSRGQLSSTKTRNVNASGVEEQIVTSYRYLHEVALAQDLAGKVLSKNLLSPVAETRVSVNGDVTGVAVETWQDWGGGRLAPHRSYAWKGTGSSSFNHALPGGADWQLGSVMVSRDGYGNVVESRDVEGVSSATVYGHRGRLPVLTVSHATAGQLLSEDFDDGSVSDADPQGWYVSSSAWQVTERGTLLSGNAGLMSVAAPGKSDMTDNFIADFSMRIPEADGSSNWAAFQFNKTSQSSTNSTGYIVFCRASGTVQLYKDGSIIGTYAKTVNAKAWHRYRVVRQGARILVYVDGEKAMDVNDNTHRGGYVGFMTYLSKGEFDDLRVYPAGGVASSVSYDPVFGQALSETGADGAQVRHLYNARGGRVASVDGQGNPIGTSMGESSAERNNGAFVAADPSVSHTVAVRGKGGVYEDFSSTTHTWAKTGTGNWQVTGGQLKSTSTSNSTYMLDLGQELKGRVGVEFDLRFDSQSGTGSGFGLELWGDGNQNERAVFLSLGTSIETGTNDAYYLRDEDWPGGITHRIKVLMDMASPSQKADYYVNGKLWLSDIDLVSSVTGLQKLVFFNYGMPGVTWTVDNVVVYADPVQTSAFADASGKGVQALSEEPNRQVLASAALYDALGRAAGAVVPTRLSGGLAYRTGFVTSFNWTTGAIAGEAQTQNTATYGNYPYSRTRFEDSPLGRAMESSLPGDGFQIGSGKTTRMAYGGNTLGLVDAVYPVGHYFVQETTDADGNVSVVMTDKAGAVVLKQSVSAKTTATMTEARTAELTEEGKVFQFTSGGTHTASFDASYAIVRIGTTPGGNQVYQGPFDSPFQNATFTAQAGVTYYVEFLDYLTHGSPPTANYYQLGYNNGYSDGQSGSAYSPNGGPCHDFPGSSECLDYKNGYQNGYANGSGGVIAVESETGTTETTTSTETGTTETGTTGTMNSDDLSSGDAQAYVQVRYTAYLSQPTYVAASRTTYAYDAQGNNTAVYPPNYHASSDGRHATTMKYDFLGRLKEKITPDAGMVRYLYDQAGRVRFMQDAKGAAEGNVLYFDYDAKGRLVEEGYAPAAWDEAALTALMSGGALAAPQSYELSAGSYSTTQTKQANNITAQGAVTVTSGELTLLASNSITLSPGFSVSASGGGAFTARTGELTGGAEPVLGKVWRKRLTYGGHGGANLYGLHQVVVAETSSDADAAAEVTETFDFDRDGNLARKGQQVTGFYSDAASNAAFNVDYVYDNLGNRVSVDYNDAAVGTVKYTYDIAGRLSAVGTASDAAFFASYAYGVNGQLAAETLTLGSGNITRNYTYNGQGRLAQLGDASYFGETLTYYSSGLVNTAAYAFKWTGGGANIANPGGYTVNYGYDALGQLTSADNSLGTTYDLTMAYDGNGNITSRTLGGVTKNYVYQAGTNRVLNTKGLQGQTNVTADYRYDQNGNVTYSSPKSLTQLTYDPYLKKTVGVTRAAGTTEYAYGAAGQRVLKYDVQGPNAEMTLYVHGGGDYPLIERTVTGQGGVPSSARNTYYVEGASGTAAILQDGQWVYPLKDALGSTRVVVTRATGAVLSQQDYLPFGGVLRAGTVGVKYRYTGQEADTETGLQNYRARLYDEDLGRFYATDPQEQFHSPYLYAGNNPVIMTDPDGEIAFMANILLSGIFGGIQAKENGGKFKDGFIVGAISGTLGTFLNPAALGVKGIIPGSIVGGASGAIAGGVSGGLTSMAMGGSFKDGFSLGAISGGIMGAISGGIKGGLSAVNDPHERNIMFGRIKRSYLENHLNNYINNNYPNWNHGRNIKWQVKSISQMGTTSIDGSDITIKIKRSIVKQHLLGKNINQMYLTSGHEANHAGDYVNGNMLKYRNTFLQTHPNATNDMVKNARAYLSEINAYQWQLREAMRLQYRVQHYTELLDHYLNLYNGL